MHGTHGKVTRLKLQFHQWSQDGGSKRYSLKKGVNSVILSTVHLCGNYENLYSFMGKLRFIHLTCGQESQPITLSCGVCDLLIPPQFLPSALPFD